MSGSARTLRFTVNGTAREVTTDPGRALVDVLRTGLGLVGTHVGCRNGACGACTVLVDGASFKSCLVPVARVAGQAVETLEGLADEDELHPVQQAFWDHNGFQCGFCLAGHILCTVELMRATQAAAPEDIAEALRGNLCRCTGYEQILAAARSALAQAGQPGPCRPQLGDPEAVWE